MTTSQKCLEPVNSEVTPESEPKVVEPNLLITPHTYAIKGPQWIEEKSRALSLLQGDYRYYHYGVTGEKDEGWGCCYRTIQTVISWYRMKNLTEKGVPSIAEIQRLLQEKDPAHVELKIGSPTWIGSVEGSYILNWYLNYECRAIHLTTASELTDYVDSIATHFENQGGPLIVGVGQFAYLIVGICNDARGNAKNTGFLVVDPHCETDNLNVVQKKWVLWRKLDFFSSKAGNKFINICLPTVNPAD